jgi:death-on-curing protein
MRYLTYDEAITVANVATGMIVEVRNPNALASAVARPEAGLFGQELYPDLWTKAAALLHSLTANHPLKDGNKRLGFGVTAVFLHVNGHPLTLDEDTAYNLVMDIASGVVDDVDIISKKLQARSLT